jgi:transposase
MDSVIAAGRRKRRPNFPTAFKKALAQQANVPGVSVSQLAQQRGVNVNMLFKWRRQLVAGMFDAPASPQVMLPVTLIDIPASAVPAIEPKRKTASVAAPATKADVARHGVIEIQIADATIRFDDSADLSRLRAVVRMLRT